jgi:tRNA-5-methyluridine54 2-sulfurtransferase
MHCSLCKNKAITLTVQEHPQYVCKTHFLEYFETKVMDTIERLNLFTKDQHLAVACSGGKDSVAILVLLSERGYDVTAVLIDEGIAGYRDKTRKELEDLCALHKIPLKVLSYEQETGASLDAILKKSAIRPCRVCGVLRRSLLHKGSKGFDALITGHNLDDEAQAILMNLLKGQVDLLKRTGPVSKGMGGFVPRVKPLYLCSEKEIRMYTYVRRFPIGYHECPHARSAFREEFSHALNMLEEDKPSTKWHLVHNFLKLRLPQNTRALPLCERCGEPCSASVCKACQLRQEISI